jgi:hypothetical protein
MDHIQHLRCPHVAEMEGDRVKLLHRRIALYRRYLREGVGLLASEYLHRISEDEAELSRLEARERF